MIAGASSAEGKCYASNPECQRGLLPEAMAWMQPQEIWMC